MRTGFLCLVTPSASLDIIIDVPVVSFGVMTLFDGSWTSSRVVFLVEVLALFTGRPV